MKLSAFNFVLPSKLIASYPARKREEARLMVVHRQTGLIEHRTFADFPSYFTEGDVVVLNDTKVAPCQLNAYKEKTKDIIKVILLRPLDPTSFLFDTRIDPARKIRRGNKLCFGNEELIAEVTDNTSSRGRTIKFSFEGAYDKFLEILFSLGEPPLPELLKRGVEREDKIRYQTVYAQHYGSVVAPFAGLHFTPYILKYLQLQGVYTPTLTLHINLATLKTIEAEDLDKYKIHAEPFHVPEQTATIVNHAKRTKKKVCAVGVSTFKAMESSLSNTHELAPRSGVTDKFITPPYITHVPTCLLTNFHIPKSMPFINTLAFGGHQLVMHAYHTAIQEKYRFFAYGDALLIL